MSQNTESQRTTEHVCSRCSSGDRNAFDEKIDELLSEHSRMEVMEMMDAAYDRLDHGLFYGSGPYGDE